MIPSRLNLDEMAHYFPIALPQRDSLLKTADARLHPSLRDPNFLVLRSRKMIFEKWIAELEGTELNVLDVGGRYQPYRPLLGERAKRYYACDILQTELVDVLGSGESLPFADNTFDVVIATQVFEYFARPHNAAEQICRVLKPGGSLLMSVAALAPRFVDEECWRFTPRGIRATLASFCDVKIVPELSSAGGTLRTLNLAVQSFSRYKPLQAIARVTTCPILNVAGLAVDALRLTDNDQFTSNYSVLARK